MRAVVVVVVFMFVVVVVALGLLVWPLQLIRLDSPAAELDALKTALAIGAGSAGLATLWLAARRQVHHEYASSMAELDASERRITDLFSKSVEQLGADKSAIRLGALYALERLADSAPPQRQTIVNIICAYLRMPYVLPPAIRFEFEPERGLVRPVPRRGDGRPGAIDTWATMASYVNDPRGSSIVESTMTVEAALAEWQVRVAAQRILSDHLRSDESIGEERIWRDIDLDLSGATLFDFDFRDCRVRSARFRSCRFYGVARFRFADFQGPVEFDGAEFFGSAWFESVAFRRDAWFGGSVFHNVADYRNARFGRVASFGGERAWLGSAVFAKGVSFEGARFEVPLELGGARVKVVDDARQRIWPTGWVAVSAEGDAAWAVLERLPAPEPS